LDFSIRWGLRPHFNFAEEVLLFLVVVFLLLFLNSNVNARLSLFESYDMGMLLSGEGFFEVKFNFIYGNLRFISFLWECARKLLKTLVGGKGFRLDLIFIGFFIQR
jgi:hypothetical protein